MSIADEIERLQALHAQGALTDEKVAQAKAALLDWLSDQQPAPYASDLHEEMQYLRVHNEINQLDRDWDRERETYMVRGRYGARYLPSEGTSLLGSMLIVGFGLFWTISAASMGAPAFFPNLWRELYCRWRCNQFHCVQQSRRVQSSRASLPGSPPAAYLVVLFHPARQILITFRCSTGIGGRAPMVQWLM